MVCRLANMLKQKEMRNNRLDTGYRGFFRNFATEISETIIHQQTICKI